ncbi:MAG: hypothetical protein K1Y36_07445 [Blastocatellia bacterium]|nr:hypothetical protein [Blastocatellia bacterium]
MTTKQELAASLSLDDPEAAVELGYKLCEVDQRAYCEWVLDCAAHILPICQANLTDSSGLVRGVQLGRDFLAGKAGVPELEQALEVLSLLLKSLQPPINVDVFEAVIAVKHALALLLPDSRVCHEDILYGAARAVWQAEGSRLEDVFPPVEEGESHDWEGAEEVVEAESLKERLWQLKALHFRLVE